MKLRTTISIQPELHGKIEEFRAVWKGKHGAECSYSFAVEALIGKGSSDLLREFEAPLSELQASITDKDDREEALLALAALRRALARW